MKKFELVGWKGWLYMILVTTAGSVQVGRIVSLFTGDVHSGTRGNVQMVSAVFFALVFLRVMPRFRPEWFREIPAANDKAGTSEASK